MGGLLPRPFGGSFSVAAHPSPLDGKLADLQRPAAAAGWQVEAARNV